MAKDYSGERVCGQPPARKSQSGQDTVGQRRASYRDQDGPTTRPIQKGGTQRSTEGGAIKKHTLGDLSSKA